MIDPDVQIATTIDPLADTGDIYGTPLAPFDPFKDPFRDTEEPDALGAKEYVHIRVQQRNGKKCLTIVEGLKEDLDFKKKLKDLKREFCCNGNVVEDKKLGKIIQLQGDQRNKVLQFLVDANIADKERIKIHGF
ncbi:hypothetical protein C1H46_014965 [Malus baccata]|uniref:SUI1 domain-containing protein n=1 Tax=Malus baccata TaxID=106549 RepID=A0A540MKS5_MALBA|nr:hypothetical protein C1H46_014965 [Malus baccata]